ncbi:MMPL family transporter [Streptomyces sparsus]
MATHLYALGRLAFRRRHVVTLVWVALLVLAGVGAGTASTPKPASFSLSGAEAQQAFDLLDERFPGSSPDGATARVVFRAPEGQKITDAANKAEVMKTVEALKGGSDQVVSVVDPYTAQAVSQDASTAFVQVTYQVQGHELAESAKQALEDTVHRAQDSGLTAEVGGTAVQAQPAAGGTAEAIGVAVAALVLVITFGSLVAAGLPLLSALIGVGIGFASIYALANTLNLGDNTGSLAMMLGLAVGIDYALFIVSRYRSELALGHEREEAAGRAVGTAGSAVVFAGLTVVIALAGLSVVNISALTKIGLGAAATVGIAVLVALTFIPAMLGYAGDKVVSRRSRTADEAGRDARADTDRPNMGTRWARLVMRRPIAVLLTGTVGLGVIALPVASLELGLPDDGSQPTSTTQRKAYDLLAEGFGPGFNGPLVVVVDAGSSDNPKAAADDVAGTVQGLDGVQVVTPAQFNKTGDTAMITVIPASEPSSAETEDLVENIRDAGAEAGADSGAKVLVTGQTAMNIDFSRTVSDALVPYLALVVGLAFLLLMVVFRSVLVPLKAALGFLLSVLAALGAVVAVFQWGWLASLLGVEETGPIMSLTPIFMIGVVFGLAMDYEVFLVTRMREAFVHGETPGQAVVTGFQHGARVVTAAALIMIAVFAGFIGAHEAMIKVMGFGLAAAVLLDAFVVRMALVPAVLALLGRAAWWLPAWLDRVLPNVDVEGERLNKAPVDGSSPGDSSPEGMRTARV